MRKNKSGFMVGVEERKGKKLIIFLFQTKIKVSLKKNKNAPLGPPELPSPKSVSTNHSLALREATCCLSS